MAFTKYAHYEVDAILDVKGSRERAVTANLSKVADFENFRTEDGYLYARIRAISSRVNKNHDGWPSVELAGDPDIFDQHRYASEGKGFTVEAKAGAKYGFSTFLGKPIFVDHHNSDPGRARGVIVDSKLHVEDQKTASMDPYYSSSDVDREHTPPTWIELLLEVDAKAFPKFAKAILDGADDPSKGIDGFSMGCNVEKSVCNICKNAATTPDEFCSHIRQKGRNFQFRDEATGNYKTAKSYENCYGVQFFEISGVFDPADETALSMEVRAGVHKEAAMPDFERMNQHGDMIQPYETGSDIDVSSPNQVSQRSFLKNCPTCGGIGVGNDPTTLDDTCPDCRGTGELESNRVPVRGEGFNTPHSIGPGAYGDADTVMDQAADRGHITPRQGSPLPAPQQPAPIQPGLNTPGGARQEAKCPTCSGLGGSCQTCGGTGSITTGGGGEGAVTPGGPQGQFQPGNGLLPSNMTLNPTRDQFGVTLNDPRWSSNLEDFQQGAQQLGVDPEINDPFAPDPQQIEELAASLVHQGLPMDQARALAEQKLRREGPTPTAPGGDGQTYEPKRWDYNDMPDFPGLHGQQPGKVFPDNSQLGPFGQAAADALEDRWGPSIRNLHKNDPRWSNTKVADNPVPQADLTKAPSVVDTLREEKTCPICGEKLEDGSCDLCGYIEPPDQFNNPDLDRAKEVRQDIPQQSGPDGAERIIPAQGGQLDTPNPNIPRPVAHVKNDMNWKVTHLAGRINNVEQPIKPGNAPSSNEPRENVVKDEERPVTSHVRTAGDILASVGREQENTMKRVAEQSATPADASAAPDVRTDVTGVGGITDASNEQASKADAQVAVDGVGGTGVENVDASGHASVEQTSDNAGFQPGGQKGPDTDTWSGTDGNGVTKQQDAVSRDPFPASDEGVKKSHDDKAFPEDDGGLAGGGAVQGVKPIAEQFGDRVDVLDHVTSPSNNSGPTKTWSGTDGNGVLKQQDPTTSEVFAPWTSKVVAAVKLAELEIGLGLLPEAQKWARIGELEGASDERVATELAYAERVRTAGLKRIPKTAATEGEVVKTAKKLPVLGRPSQMRTTSVQTPDDDPLGGTLFGL